MLQLNEHVIRAYLKRTINALTPDWLRHIPLTDTGQSGEAARHRFQKGKETDFGRLYLS